MYALNNEKKILMKIRALSIVCLLLVIIAIPAGAYAAEVSVSIDVKNSFTYGDLVYFSYEIISSEDTTIVYVPSVNCSSGLTALLELMQSDLKAGVPYSGNYTYDTVSENTPPQTCTAQVSILLPSEKIEKKEFTISTLQALELEIYTYEDAGRTKTSKIFASGSTAYLSAYSPAGDITASATIQYPDTKSEAITLPASILLRQAGTYTLNVTASKNGYKNTTKTAQFSVIEQPPSIPDEKIICNNNNICELSLNESKDNCPQDCVPKQKIENPVIEKNITTTAETETKITEKNAVTEENNETPENNKTDSKTYGLILLLAAIALCAILSARNKKTR